MEDVVIFMIDLDHPEKPHDLIYKLMQDLDECGVEIKLDFI